MSWLRVLASRIRGLFLKRHLERELDEELRAHIEMATEENLRKGMTPKDARHAARRAFGGIEQTKEVYRVRRGLPVIEAVLSDVSYALRMLRKNPGFTAVVVLSMALGIGANTAIFSLIDAVLLTMLPVQDPQQVVLLHWASHGWPNGILHSLAAEVDHDKSGRMASTGFSYPTYEQIRARNRVFSNVLAIAANGSQLNVGYEGQHARADGNLVSGTFFSTLGVQPILGRTLSPDDDRAGASPVAVISYGYWERRFGRDPAIVGR